MGASPFKTELGGLNSNGNGHHSRENLHNNIIVEDEKEEINYSTSNHSTNRMSKHSKERVVDNERLHTDAPNYNNDKKKDLVAQMRDKIKRKQRNNKFESSEISKILVLGTSGIDESYKNTEYNDFGVNNVHNISNFNNKQSKKVSSLGRSPHKKKTKIIKKIPFKQSIPKNSMYNRSMYGHESSNTLSRMTRDSFNKKPSNQKEIVLADSSSYISSVANIPNKNHPPLDQKLHLLQRESMSRGSLAKPPGTSGGRLPKHFGIEEVHPKRYLPKLKATQKQDSERSEYTSSQRQDEDDKSREKRTQPNQQAVSRGSRRDKRKQFAIFPEGFDPHEEL